MLRNEGRNQQCTKRVQIGYTTPAVWSILNAAQWGTKLVPHKWADWLRDPLESGGHQRFRAGTKSKVHHKEADWLPNAFRVGGSQHIRTQGKHQLWPTNGLMGHKTLALWGSQCFRAGHKDNSGPPMGRFATQPGLSRGVPSSAKRRTKSAVAHKWADWRHNPYRPRCFQDFGERDKLRSGPQGGALAT